MQATSPRIRAVTRTAMAAMVVGVVAGSVCGAGKPAVWQAATALGSGAAAACAQQVLRTTPVPGTKTKAGVWHGGRYMGFLSD
jgi:hypothetical protein